MGLSFNPKTEQEVKTGMNAPAGEYDFEVLFAKDRTSKQGNAMIEIKIGIYRGEAISNHVFDYLLAKMEAKLRHFCDTTGLLAKYESGTLCAEDCVGRSGRVKISIREAEGNFEAKNEVKDYICRPAKEVAKPGEQAKSPAEDDGDSEPF